MADPRQEQKPQAPQKSGSGKPFLLKDGEIKSWRDLFVVAAMQRDNIVVPVQEATVKNGIEVPAKNTTLANADLYEIFEATLNAREGDTLVRLFDNMLQRTEDKTKQKFLFPNAATTFLNKYVPQMTDIFNKLQPSDFKETGVGDEVIVTMPNTKNATFLWDAVDRISKAFEKDLEADGFFQQVPKAATDKTFMNFLTAAILFKTISNTSENLTKSKKIDELTEKEKGIRNALQLIKLPKVVIQLSLDQDTLQKEINKLTDKISDLKKKSDPNQKKLSELTAELSEKTKKHADITRNKIGFLADIKDIKKYFKDQSNGTEEQRIYSSKLRTSSEEELLSQKENINKLLAVEKAKIPPDTMNKIRGVLNPLKKFVILQKYRRTAPVADANPETVATNPTPPAESVTAKPVTAEAKPVTAEAKPVTAEAKPVTAEAKSVTPEAKSVTPETKPPTSPNLKARVANLRNAALNIGAKQSRNVKTFATEKVGQLAKKIQTEIAKRASAEPKHGTADIMTTLKNPQWNTNPDWVNETSKSIPTTPGNSETKKRTTTPQISTQRIKNPPVEPSVSPSPKQEPEKAIEKPKTIEEQTTLKPGGRR